MCKETSIKHAPSNLHTRSSLPRHASAHAAWVVTNDRGNPHTLEISGADSAMVNMVAMTPESGGPTGVSAVGRGLDKPPNGNCGLTNPTPVVGTPSLAGLSRSTLPVSHAT